MDSFELNKIIGAILGTLLFVMGAGFLADAIYAPKASGPGYELPEPEGTAAEEPVVVAAADIGTLLAAANAEQGASVARRCAGCHNFEQGAGHKQGPELFAVVGHPIAGHPDYSYSPALEAHSGDTWTYDNLNAFLRAPGEFAPKTKMSFGGLKDDAERANLIAYLASISPDAPAFPAPAPAGEPAGEAADAAAGEQAPIGEAPAAADQEAARTDAGAIATPETTASETPVQGTPTTSGPAGAEPAAPAAGTAPAAEAAPAAPAAGTAPATRPPVTTPAPAPAQ